MSRRVAAVLAAYNHEDYVAEAVDSLASQVDQVVVVDDASDDGTWDVLQGLASRVVTVLRNDRRSGVSRSFSRAIEAADADIVLIQGADDRSLPDRAARQMAVLDEPGVVLAAALPAVIDGAGKRLPDSVAGEFRAGPRDGDPLPFLFFKANFICAPSVALRRDDYFAAGAFPVGIDLLQDHALWLALCARGELRIDDVPVVEYRKHGANLSREYVGVDAPKQRRLAAERDWMLSSFLRGADTATLHRLALVRGISAAEGVDPSDEELRTLLLVSHDDKSLRRRGLSRLFDLAAGDPTETAFARLGFDHGDLARLAVLADHGNLDDVNNALDVSLRLGEVDPRSAS